jgi:flagellar motility protein MotE (MotC chaperone)
MSDAPDPAAEEKNSGKPDKKKPEKTAKPAASKGEKPKKKGPNIVLILVPVAIAAALVLAFTLPPTHALIVKSPLRPLLAKVGLLPKDEALAAGKATPVSDPAADVKRLSNELDASKSDAAAKDALIAQLQSQLKAAAASPSPSPSPKATPSTVSDDVKRVATYWESMDADKAAEIAGRLPDAYVKLVFSQMPADAVGDIMAALPTKTVARLTGPPSAAAQP